MRINTKTLSNPNPHYDSSKCRMVILPRAKANEMRKFAPTLNDSEKFSQVVRLQRVVLYNGTAPSKSGRDAEIRPNPQWFGEIFAGRSFAASGAVWLYCPEQKRTRCGNFSDVSDSRRRLSSYACSWDPDRLYSN